MCADTTLHFEPSSGISGDMSVAVLTGLGMDIAEAADAVSRMAGVRIFASVTDVQVNGVVCKRLKLELPREIKNRNINDIRAMFEASDLSSQVISESLGVFDIVAQAESKAHGVPADSVHFHEVGALDSIFDIAVFAYGKERLGIKRVTSSAPALGNGFVKCVHGVIPVPVPAVLNILEGREIRQSHEQAEMTTPTGAAILKYYTDEFKPMSGRIVRSAFSTGNKTFSTVPNILRGILMDKVSAFGNLIEIETVIDDCTGEQIGFLFAAVKPYCLDMTVEQGLGKKNRPVFIIRILCTPAKKDICAETLFRHTSTAGVRFYLVDRLVMDREMVDVCVNGEKVNLKVLSYKDIKKASPEWDDCVRAGENLNLSPSMVYDLAKAEYLKGSSAD